MSLPSAKEFSVAIINMLNVEEADFDYNAYSSAVNEFVTGLLAEVMDRAGPKLTNTRQTALMREYCQRFDSAVHRIEQADTKIKPQYPLFKGAVFCLFIHAVKETTKDPIRAVAEIESIAEGLPYRSDNPLVKVMLDDLRGDAEKVVDAEIERAKAIITGLFDEVRDRSGMYKAISTSRTVIAKTRNGGAWLQLHMYAMIQKTTVRLTMAEAAKGK